VNLTFDLLCFSHLRWDFVYQRPQHLLSRCARERRVFFIEEPILDSDAPRLEVSPRGENIVVVVPHLPEGGSEPTWEDIPRSLLDEFIIAQEIEQYVLWYYTPNAIELSRHLEPTGTVYDCMDELSAFRGAPPGLRAAEAELFSRADLVFTGGQTLYKSKQGQHHSVHCFPSSIDYSFFSQARKIADEPADQASIPHPRLGFCGVIDERMDLELLATVAAARPDWHFVMIGPVVKIVPSDLPTAANIHYLGGKKYEELPSYLSGWDVALLPFALNESTRFISPTKTPEYLAAGLPVVSTPIADVVNPYGNDGHVHIAATPGEFIAAISEAISTKHSQTRLNKADALLSTNSWDLTWRRMARLVEDVISQAGGKLRLSQNRRKSLRSTSSAQAD
jgi:glycosyltransferase involved in cell wall biosynthesis